MKLIPFWVRWFDHEPSAFEYHGPWWVSGERGDGAIVVVAAVMARGEEHARQVIREAHDDKADQEWSFVEPRDAGWEPFCDRFSRRDWMRWPWPNNEVPQ